MKFSKLKKILVYLFFGCICSIVLMYFEFRYALSDVDFDQNFPGPMLVLLIQSILLAMIILAATLSLRYVKRDIHKEKANTFEKLEKIGLALQLISFFIMLGIFYFPYGSFLLIIINILLLCFGFIIYRQTKNNLSKSFMLWGSAMLMLLFLLNSISASWSY